MTIAPDKASTGAPDATVVITTKNRKRELRDAVASALNQIANVEVLVVDDGSTDGTAESITGEFPAARVVRHEESRGYIVRRNEGARLASAGIIVSIDDDAAFPSRHTIEQALAGFDDPRIGAVAVPFINVRQDNSVRQLGPADPATVDFTFIGTAHALRRDIFVELGGYREQLIHQGEENDYCIRMLAAGYVVRLGTADPIHHFESPRRDFRRMDYYGRRNDILFAWHNVPMPQFIPHMLGSTMNGLLFGARRGRLWRMARGLAAGYAAIPGEWRQRRPIPPDTYRLFRELKTRGPRPLTKIEGRLKPIMIPAASAS